MEENLLVLLCSKLMIIMAMFTMNEQTKFIYQPLRDSIFVARALLFFADNEKHSTVPSPSIFSGTKDIIWSDLIIQDDYLGYLMAAVANYYAMTSKHSYNML